MDEMQSHAIHTIPVADGWENRLADSQAPLSRHASKMDAVHTGRTLARERGTALVVHRRDGAPPARLECRPRRA